ncbi:hypothetical protein BFW87_18940 [Pseudomonas fluorescens]|uniref:DUF3757 domain-containing protein n=1 Tax=Pseudomonas fluorescens TaxID=294 RepID=A0A1T2YHP0_PSEFL|nr:DUF3757 domain-containing protein [Pseudomonas fluorescens]OPA91702.1 hypothetical protein BFW87_18940 [Pseudomonas fluorescens]
MIRPLTYLFFLLAAVSHPVVAEQGCPYPSAVRYVDGRFQAVTGTSFWQSTKANGPGFVDRFVGALFTPDKGGERDNGHLDRCVYYTGSGQVVALRYSMPDKTMSLTNSLHWELTADPLQQKVYICQDSQPDNCAFTVDRPK